MSQEADFGVLSLNWQELHKKSILNSEEGPDTRSMILHARVLKNVKILDTIRTSSLEREILARVSNATETIPLSLSYELWRELRNER